MYGICGAAAGTGVAYSILNHATPLTGDARSRANQLSGSALVAISQNVGPRCCKREAITSIQSFAENTPYFDGIQTTDYVCSQAAQNKDCIGKSCPFFRANKADAPKSNALKAAV